MSVAEGNNDVETSHTQSGPGLRDRNTLREPSRYRDSVEELRLRISAKRRERSGKQTSIDKRVNTILNLIRDNGSRTKIRFLHSELCRILEEAVSVHEDLMSLLQDDDDDCTNDWIEDLRAVVSDCGAEIAEYLERRADDTLSVASSNVSLCSNWLLTGSMSGRSEYDQTETTIRHLSNQFGDSLTLASPVNHEQLPVRNISSPVSTSTVHTSYTGTPSGGFFMPTSDNYDPNISFSLKDSRLQFDLTRFRSSPVTSYVTPLSNDSFRGPDVRKRTTSCAPLLDTTSAIYAHHPDHLQQLRPLGMHTNTVSASQNTQYQVHSQPWLSSVSPVCNLTSNQGASNAICANVSLPLSAPHSQLPDMTMYDHVTTSVTQPPHSGLGSGHLDLSDFLQNPKFVCFIKVNSLPNIKK